MIKINCFSHSTELILEDQLYVYVTADDYNMIFLRGTKSMTFFRYRKQRKSCYNYFIIVNQGKTRDQSALTISACLLRIRLNVLCLMNGRTICFSARNKSMSNVKAGLYSCEKGHDPPRYKIWQSCFSQLINCCCQVKLCTTADWAKGNAEIYFLGVPGPLTPCLSINLHNSW